MKETLDELIINVNYIKSINFSSGEMLDYTPMEFENKFLFDRIGEQYFQRPLLKIVTESDSIILSFEEDSDARKTYADIKAKLSCDAGRAFFAIDLNSKLYRVAHTL